MASTTAAVPEENYKPADWRNVTMVLTFQGDCAKALSAYEEVFDANIQYVMKRPDQEMIHHACFSIGDTTIMAHDDYHFLFPQSNRFDAARTHSLAYVYVSDCDAVVAKAVAAGFTLLNACKDEFWGDRVGEVADTFGHKWMIVTQCATTPSPEEMQSREAEWFKAMSAPV